MITGPNPEHPLHNIEFVLAERRRAAEALEAAVDNRPSPRDPSAEQLQQWAATLKDEGWNETLLRYPSDQWPLKVRLRRELAEFFDSHETYAFEPSGRERMTGTHCADRLRLGDDYFVYFQAQSHGEWWRPRGVGRRPPMAILSSPGNTQRKQSDPHAMMSDKWLNAPAGTTVLTTDTGALRQPKAKESL